MRKNIGSGHACQAKAMRLAGVLDRSCLLETAPFSSRKVGSDRLCPDPGTTLNPPQPFPNPGFPGFWEGGVLFRNAPNPVVETTQFRNLKPTFPADFRSGVAAPAKGRPRASLDQEPRSCRASSRPPPEPRDGQHDTPPLRTFYNSQQNPLCPPSLLPQ